jgi:hypothetical protein
MKRRVFLLSSLLIVLLIAFRSTNVLSTPHLDVNFTIESSNQVPKL